MFEVFNLQKISMESKLVSIILPAHNEESNIFYIYNELKKILDNLEWLKYRYDYEIIFVNDWSKDSTWVEITKLGLSDDVVKWINFSRNFGKEIALTAGIEKSKWDCVVTLDCDWQHPVEQLPLFLKTWEDWYDIVYNKRPQIKWASILKRFSSWLFYYVFNKISDFKLEPSTTDYRLLDRKIVRVFLKLEERNRIYRWLIDWLGFNKKALIFDAKERVNWSAVSYNYIKLMKLATDSITSFSLFPLKIVWYLGLSITIFSWMLLVLMIADRLIWFGLYFTNLAIVTVINTFLIWIVLMSLWLIALYIANIHEEVRWRPLYIIKEKINIE